PRGDRGRPLRYPGSGRAGGAARVRGVDSARAGRVDRHRGGVRHRARRPATAGEPADDRRLPTGARRSRAVTAVAATARRVSDAPAVHGRRVLTVGLPVIAAVVLLLTVPFLNQPVGSWEWRNRSADRALAIWGIPALGVAPGAGAGPQS